MKKVIAILLVALLVASCATAAFASETYEGIGNGKNGPVKVSVTLDAGKITDVTVLDQAETVGVADGALEKIPSEIVQTQSVAVDAVTGATMTSAAIIEAVEDCLRQAGEDVSSWQVAVDEAVVEKETVQLTTDVVVIGAGISGLSTAISAKTNGADVIVVEKLNRTGGSAMFCSGNFASYNTTSEKEQGIEDSLELALQHWEERQAQSIEDMGTINYDRVAYILPETAKTIDWYTSLGVEYEPSTAPKFASLSTTRVVGRGAGMVKAVTEIAESLGVDIRLSTPATSLIVEDGKVVGVIAENDTQILEIRSNSIVLATGGFGADHDEVSEKVPLYSKAISLASAGNTGDGIEMALAAGAVEYPSPWVIPYTIQPAAEIKAQVPEAAILTDNRHNGIFADKAVVNENGERFVDESQQYSVVSINLAYSTYENYLILDSTDEEVANIMDQCLDTGKVFKGETLEELAASAGIGDALVETIAKYNADAETGDTLFGKSADKMTAYAETGPYYAVCYSPGMTGTFGGVVTDFEGHVLNADGDVIEGLYAVGEMSNREYFNQTYMGAASVSFSSTMGRLVGELVAK